ncbi:hypothetical protein Tco_1008286 [Tanacetum coccineum]
MSNTNNTMQTQTSNALHNAIMKAGSKDRPPMLAPGSRGIDLYSITLQDTPTPSPICLMAKASSSQA